MGRDFDAMSKEELLSYLENENNLTDITEWVIAGGSPGPAVVTVEDPDDATLRVTTIRLPKSVIVELDQRFGHTRDGRSGFIRDAVMEKLARLRAEGAA
jgi:hypothetical protein